MIKRTREQILYEIERFTKSNYLWFFAALVVSFSYFSYLVFSLSSDVKKVEEVLTENLNTVMAVTDSGTLIEVEKQELFSDMQKNIISRALRNLVVSRNELTDGFKQSTFEDNEEIVERGEKLKYFLQFILIDNPKKVKDLKVLNSLTGNKTSVIALKDQAIGYFDGYIESLKQKLQKDTIPHFMNINRTKVTSFSPKGKSFRIEVVYDVIMQNFDGYNKDNSMKYKTLAGRYVIKAAGYFDIRTRSIYKLGSESNGINKIGLHFTSLKIKTPKN